MRAIYDGLNQLDGILAQNLLYYQTIAKITYKLNGP